VKEFKRLLPEIFIPDLFQPGFDKSEHGVVGDPEPGVIITISFSGAFFPREFK